MAEENWWDKYKVKSAQPETAAAPPVTTAPPAEQKPSTNWWDKYKVSQQTSGVEPTESVVSEYNDLNKRIKDSSASFDYDSAKYQELQKVKQRTPEQDNEARGLWNKLVGQQMDLEAESEKAEKLRPAYDKYFENQDKKLYNSDEALRDKPAFGGIVDTLHDMQSAFKTESSAIRESSDTEENKKQRLAKLSESYSTGRSKIILDAATKSDADERLLNSIAGIMREGKSKLDTAKLVEAASGVDFGGAAYPSGPSMGPSPTEETKMQTRSAIDAALQSVSPEDRYRVEQEADSINKLVTNDVDTAVVNNELRISPKILFSSDENVSSIIQKANATDEQKRLLERAVPQLRAQTAKEEMPILTKLPEFNDFVKSNGMEDSSDVEKIKAWKSENSSWYSNLDEKFTIGLMQGWASIVQQTKSLVAAGAYAAAKSTGSEWASKTAGTWMGEALEQGRYLEDLNRVSEAYGGSEVIPQFVSTATQMLPILASGVVVGLGARGSLALAGRAITPAVAASLGFGTSVGAAGLQSFSSTFADATDALKNKYTQNGMEEDAAMDLAMKKAYVPAVLSGVSTAAVTALGGMTGEMAIFRLGKDAAFKGTVKTFVKDMASNVFKDVRNEAVEELTDQIIQGVISKYTYNPDKPIKEIVEEAVLAGVMGGLLGGTMGAGTFGLDTYNSRKAIKQSSPKLEKQRQAIGLLEQDVQSLYENIKPSADFKTPTTFSPSENAASLGASAIDKDELDQINAKRERISSLLEDETMSSVSRGNLVSELSVANHEYQKLLVKSRNNLLTEQAAEAIGGIVGPDRDAASAIVKIANGMGLSSLNGRERVAAGITESTKGFSNTTEAPLIKVEKDGSATITEAARKKVEKLGLSPVSRMVDLSEETKANMAQVALIDATAQEEKAKTDLIDAASDPETDRLAPESAKAAKDLAKSAPTEGPSVADQMAAQIERAKENARKAITRRVEEVIPEETPMEEAAPKPTVARVAVKPEELTRAGRSIAGILEARGVDSDTAAYVAKQIQKEARKLSPTALTKLAIQRFSEGGGMFRTGIKQPEVPSYYEKMGMTPEEAKTAVENAKEVNMSASRAVAEANAKWGGVVAKPKTEAEVKAAVDSPKVPFEAISPSHAKFSKALDKLIKGGALSQERKLILQEIFRDTAPKTLNMISEMRAEKGLGTGGWYTIDANRAKAWIQMTKDAVKKFEGGIASDSFWNNPMAEPTVIFLHEYGHIAYWTVLTNEERATIDGVYEKLKSDGRISGYVKEGMVTTPKQTRYIASNAQDFATQSFAEYTITNKVPDDAMKPILGRMLKKFTDAIGRIRNRANVSPEAKLIEPILKKMLQGVENPQIPRGFMDVGGRKVAVVEGGAAAQLSAGKAKALGVEGNLPILHLMGSMPEKFTGVGNAAQLSEKVEQVLTDLRSDIKAGKFNNTAINKKPYEAQLGRELSQQEYDTMLADMRSKQERIYNGWVDYLENGGYAPEVQSLILNAITKEIAIPKADGGWSFASLGKNADRLPDPASPELAAFVAREVTLPENKAKRISQIIAEGSAAAEESRRNQKEQVVAETETGDSITWVRFPSKEEDPANFDRNVQDLTSLAKTSSKFGKCDWCTGNGAAAGQLQMGDFWVGVDPNGNARVAVRMNGSDEIAEVRGILEGQDLETSMAPAVVGLFDEKGWDGGEWIDEAKMKTELAEFIKNAATVEEAISGVREVAKKYGYIPSYIDALVPDDVIGIPSIESKTAYGGAKIQLRGFEKFVIGKKVAVKEIKDTPKGAIPWIVDHENIYEDGDYSSSAFHRVHVHGAIATFDFVDLLLSSGSSVVTVKEIGNYASSHDTSTINVETIEANAYGYGSSTINVEIVRGNASSRDTSTINVETVGVGAYSRDTSTINVETVKSDAISYGSSTINAGTVKRDASSRDTSTINVETVKRDAISRDTSTINVETVWGVAYSRDTSTINVETVWDSAYSDGSSTINVETVEMNATSGFRSTINSETINGNVDTRQESSINATVINGDVTTDEKSKATTNVKFDIDALQENLKNTKGIAEKVRAAIEAGKKPQVMEVGAAPEATRSTTVKPIEDIGAPIETEVGGGAAPKDSMPIDPLESVVPPKAGTPEATTMSEMEEIFAEDERYEGGEIPLRLIVAKWLGSGKSVKALAQAIAKHTTLDEIASINIAEAFGSMYEAKKVIAELEAAEKADKEAEAEGRPTKVGKKREYSFIKRAKEDGTLTKDVERMVQKVYNVLANPVTIEEADKLISGLSIEDAEDLIKDKTNAIPAPSRMAASLMIVKRWAAEKSKARKMLKNGEITKEMFNAVLEAQTEYFDWHKELEKETGQAIQIISQWESLGADGIVYKLRKDFKKAMKNSVVTYRATIDSIKQSVAEGDEKSFREAMRNSAELIRRIAGGAAKKDAKVKAFEERAKDYVKRAAGEIKIEKVKKLGGVPVWDQYKDAFSKRLARFLMRKGEGEKTIPPPLQDFTSRMAEILLGFVPESAKKDATPKDFQRYVQEALNDKPEVDPVTGEETRPSKYVQAIQKALLDISSVAEDVKERIAMGEAVSERELASIGAQAFLEKLEKDVKDFPVSDKIIVKFIEQKAKRLEISIIEEYTKWYKSSKNKREELSSVLGKVMSEDLSISAQDRQDLQKKIIEDFSKKAEERRKKSLERYKTPRKAGEKVAVSHLQKFFELTNMGALTDEDAYTIMAKKHSLPVWDVDFAQEIYDEAQAIQDMPQGKKRKLMTQDLLTKIERRKGFHWADVVSGLIYSNMLSSPDTSITNTIDTFIKVWANAFADFVSKRDTNYLKAIISGYKKGYKSAVDVIKTGKRIDMPGFEEKAPPLLEMLDFGVKGGLPINTDSIMGKLVKAIGESKAAYHLNARKYVGRFLEAQDALNFTASVEGQKWASALARAEADGKTGKEAVAAANTYLNQTDAKWNELLTLARAEGHKGNAVVERALELQEETIPDDIKNKSFERGLKDVLRNQPKGWAGFIANWFNSHLMSITNPVLRNAAKITVSPFVINPTNLFNTWLDYSPYGYKRLFFGTGNFLPEKFRAKHEAWSPEWNAQLWKANSYILVISALWILIKMGVVKIIGKGPDDPEESRDWKDKGNKPYSIQIGNGPQISFKYTPWAIPLSVMANVMNWNEYKAKKDSSLLERYAVAMQMSTSIIMELPFFSGMSDLLELADYRSNVDFMTRAEKYAGGKFSMLFPAFVTYIDKLFDPTVYSTEGIRGMFIDRIPFARRTGKPMTNIFARPIYEERGPIEQALQRYITFPKVSDGSKIMAIYDIYPYFPKPKDAMTYNKKGEKVAMDEDQYGKAHQKFGSDLYDYLTKNFDVNAKPSEQEREATKKMMQKNIEKLRHSALMSVGGK